MIIPSIPKPPSIMSQTGGSDTGVAATTSPDKLTNPTNRPTNKKTLYDDKPACFWGRGSSGSCFIACVVGKHLRGFGNQTVVA
jgi:hypothetical protein